MADQLDVVNNQAVAVGFAGSFDLEDVLSRLSRDNHAERQNIVAIGDNRKDHFVVPENVGQARFKGYIISAGILKRKSERVAQGQLAVGS